MWSPMWMRLSAITPRPTHRFIPQSPLYLDLCSPWRRLRTLMRPSQPVRHFCSFLNQRFFCFSLRCLPGVPLEGIETRFTPNFSAPASLAGGEESGIGRERIWCVAKYLNVLLDRGKQQGRVGGTFVQDFVAGDELVFRLLNFD